MEKLLNAVKLTGGSILTIGIIIFAIGFFSNESSILTPIGIGTIMSAIFIFVMGLFLVASEEVLMKTHTGKAK